MDYYTSHVLKENAVIRIEETLHYRRAYRTLRKNLIYLEFLLKLLSFKVARLRYLHHDARVDLVDKRDAPFPDPVHLRELLPDTHINDII